MKSKKVKKEAAPSRAKKKAVAKKSTTKKTSVKELSQTNGKNYEDDAELKKVKRLEEILEVKKTNPYGTNDSRIFQENIASMNLTDLQELAVRVGVFPSGNKTVLKNKLTKSFKSENLGSSQLVIDRGPPISLDPDNPKHKEVLDYLNG
tara:strand:- start:883 stop:1329 length:447 start_codon:yes stop_codon:yes gene_type:complete